METPDRGLGARPTAKPRGRPTALAGERSEPEGLGVRWPHALLCPNGSRAETAAGPNYFFGLSAVRVLPPALVRQLKT